MFLSQAQGTSKIPRQARSIGDARLRGSVALPSFHHPGLSRLAPTWCSSRFPCYVSGPRWGPPNHIRFPDRAALAKDCRCSFQRLKAGRRFQVKQDQPAMHGSAGASPSRLFTIPGCPGWPRRGCAVQQYTRRFPAMWTDFGGAPEPLAFAAGPHNRYAQLCPWGNPVS